MRNQEIEPDFELNIASIVDCLTVLITYLLASATFLTLGVIVVTLPTFSEETVSDKPPEVTLTVRVHRNKTISVLTSGKENGSFTIPAQGETEGFDALKEHLTSLKGRFPAVESALVGAEDAVSYREMIKTIEVTRKAFPQVAISTEDVKPQ